MSFRNKRGVSLVVVLLFMLIATIAGTATYKWLSSSGSSSASRFRLREAEYAANAGIESVRSWMTFHGNETGALIRQYLDEKRAVNLKSVLPSIEGQNEEFDVWLVGADVDHKPYTVKLLSTGYAANKTAKVNKVSILKVDGLYKVKLPQKKASINFNQAVFSGPASGVSLDVSSGIVNGDVLFNTDADVDGDLVVTGDLSLNSSTKIKDLFVHGNLYSCTNFEVTNNTCVRGQMYLNGTHVYGGNVYAINGVDMSGTGTDKAQCSTGPGVSMTIEGKLTSGGNIITPKHTAGTKYIVKGDVVVNNGGKLIFPDVNVYGGMMGQQSYEVQFLGNVYLSGGINDDGFHSRYNTAQNFKLGSTGTKVYSGSRLYRVSDANAEITSSTDYYTFWGDANGMKSNGPGKVAYLSQYGGSDYVTSGEVLAPNTFCNKADCAPTDNNGANFRHNSSFYECSGTKDYAISYNPEVFFPIGQDCDIRLNNVFFQVNGDYTSSVDTTGWNADCNEGYRNAIINEAEGNCKGPHIREPLQINKDLLTSPKLHSVDKKGACTGAVEVLNGINLWQTGSADRWPVLEQCYAAAEKAGELYEGEWLLIKLSGANYQFQNINNSDILTKKYIIIFEESSSFSLPATTPDAMVLMYWLKGGEIALPYDAPTRNYFIYSDGDVAYNGGNGKPITGSIFITDCHTISGVNTVVADFNEDLLSQLTSVAAICENDGSFKCQKPNIGGGSGSGDESSSSTESGYDSYFIPVAPQLLLTSVSEYRSNDEMVSSEMVDPIKPSLLVMPRILYLPRKPKGSLSDYYEVLNLNGAEEEKTPSKVYCEPTGIPTTEKFSSFSDSLPKGFFRCTYTSTSYGDANFFVQVDDSPAGDNRIAFGTSFVEVTKGQTVNVPISVPGSQDGSPVTVDVYVTKPDDWTISGQTPIQTTSSGALYSLTFTPSTARQTVNAFTVTMPEEGSNGPAVFQMIPPCNGCTIGAPHMLSVAAPGFMTVNRLDVRQYCEYFPDNCRDENGPNHYYSAAMAPSCEEFLEPDEIWVYALGTNCQASTLAPNDQWTCNMNTAASLKKKNINALRYCDIVIPPLGNTFSAKYDNETGNLYASLVRKTKTLTINVSGAHDASSRVIVKKSATGDATEPDSDSEEEIILSGHSRSIVVYPGYRYFMYKEARGGDKFSYWKCLGKDCPAELIASNTYELLITDNNTVIANFNDVDEHCFYEDFTPDPVADSRFTSFCGANETRCIDTCDVPQSIGNSCKVSESKLMKDGKKPDWVMVYNNREASCSAHKWDYSRCYSDAIHSPLACPRLLGSTCSGKKSGTSQLPPVISNNYIVANNSAVSGGDDKNSTAAVILSTKNAGYNGTLTSLFKTEMYSMLNSGFIIRSNDDASEYFLFSVHGKNLTTAGNLLGASPNIYAKLCYVRGQTTGFNTSDKCVSKELELSSFSLGSLLSAFTTNTDLTMVLSVSGSTISASLAIDRVFLKDGGRTVSFDLASDFNGITLADDNHSFVGMKLADNSFKIQDISWMSSNFSGDCWAAPKVICSFKGNYMGGIVPKDADVTPWVGYSSFLETEKFENCKLKYYYNGCDNENDGMRNFTWDAMYRDFACSNIIGNGIGSFWDRGSTLNQNGIFYHFVTEGSHGYPYTSSRIPGLTGFAKDAKVLLDCNGTAVTPPSSLSAEQTCGTFLVGKMEICSENYDYIRGATPVSCAAGVNCSVPTLDGTVPSNMRDASLVVTFDNPNGDNISVTLVDDGGKKTVSRSTNGTSFTLNVNDVADVDDFNPQKISAVEFKGSGSFAVTSVQTSCPYALGISRCSARYNGISWTISASVNNANSCDVIPPSGLDLDPLTDVVCGEESSYSFENTTLLNGLSSTTTGTFKMRAKDGERYVEKECETQQVQPIGLTCSVDNNRETVLPGTGVPAFNYSFTGCDQYSSGKCSYEISLEGMATRGSTSATGSASGSVPPFNSINQPGSKLTEGTYRWKITGPGPDSPCHGEFYVVESNVNATAVCSVNENLLTASIFNGDDEWTSAYGVWEASTYIVDKFGVVKKDGLNAVRNQTGSTYRSEITNVNLENGDVITLVLNGDRQTGGCSFTVGASSSSSSESISSSSSVTTSSATVSATDICLTAKRWIKNEKPWELRFDGLLSEGDYVLQHDCEPTTNGWFYGCYTMGPDKNKIRIGKVEYDCKNNGDTSSTTLGAPMPVGGSAVHIPKGVTFKKIGCNGQRDSTRVPNVCRDAPASSSSAETGKCWFGKSSHNWGDGDHLKFNTSCKGCFFTVTDPAGDVVASGTTSSGGQSQENQVWVDKMTIPGDYTVSTSGFTCNAKLELPQLAASNCAINAQTLSATENANFRADITNCDNYACKWFLKKNGTTVRNGTFGNNMSTSITGNGRYTLHLISEDASSACEVSVSAGAPARDCKFNNTTRTFGEREKFKVDKLSASAGTSWTVYDPNGNSVLSGTLGYNYNSAYWETSEFDVKVDGTYSLKLDGEEACTATLNVTQPSATCNLDRTSIKLGENTEFRYNITNCKNNQCSYEVKLDGSSLESGNRSEGGFNRNVSAAGTYELWLNGARACEATLSVASGTRTSPGTYNCYMGQYNNNKSIDGLLNNGSYSFKLDRSCKQFQIHASGSGTYELGGMNYGCSYRDFSAGPYSLLNVYVPKSCNISKIYISGCSNELDNVTGLDNCP